MAEALVFMSAVQATTQLVEQAFRILARLRKAYIRQKSLVDVLTRHENELRSIKTIIGIIDDEDDLKMPSVADELVRLQDVQTRLAKLLESLDRKTKTMSTATQVAHQFFQGSADEKKLSEIMSDLVHVKAMLLLRIQLVNVSVVTNVEKGNIANAVVIQRIDETLREHIYNCEGLRIARILKGRRPSDGGTVPLTPEDLRSLNRGLDDSSDDGTLVDDSGPFPSNRTERIVTRNTARNQAAQINAPIDIDIWKDVNRLVIEDNVAEGQALQINYGTTFEITAKLMDRQEKICAVPQYKRHDSFHKV